MTISEFEAALRQLLKSVIRDVANELLPHVRNTAFVAPQMKTGRDDAMLLTAREAARRLAISPRHLSRITAEGLLPCIRVGRLVRYSVESIERWVRESESAEQSVPRPQAEATVPTAAKSPDMSKSKRQKSPRRRPEEPPEAPKSERQTGASVLDQRQSNSRAADERRSPFDLLLTEIGIKRGELGPLTNGEVVRIAGVDLPTFHGWMYLGRQMPEYALENLRRHFRNAAGESASGNVSAATPNPSGMGAVG